MVMRSKVLLASILATALVAPTTASAESSDATTEGVRMVVLREFGMGSSATAQSYLDQLIAVVAKVNAWSAATGVYQTSRTRAKTYIEASKPEFGILNLGAFLGLRATYDLKAFGQASTNGGGGEQYFVISKTASDVKNCKTLGTHIGDDTKFIDAIVFDGRMKLSDFEVVDTRRPLKTIKAVARDEVDCALVDDALLAELPNVEEAAGVTPIWSSKTFPALVIVAFPNATKAHKDAFQANLNKICTEGKDACTATGLRSLAPMKASEVEALVQAYDHAPSK